MAAPRLSATAQAHANIALAKYWGKLDDAENLPATPSLSLTLDRLFSRTKVSFEPGLSEDTVVLDGTRASEPRRARVSALLDRVRKLAGFGHRAEVRSFNNFPTASGLASSASGFAALAFAATHAAGLELAPSAISDLARQSSASAARSLFGGLVELGAGERVASPLSPASPLDLRLVVAVVTAESKAVGSTDGMRLTRETSPYYGAWVAHAPAVFERIRAGLLEGSFSAVGEATEQSALLMHASMFGADPPLVYLSSTTFAILERLRSLREAGTLAYGTMDAGPHVKVLCLPESVARVVSSLEEIPAVRETIICAAGPSAHLIEAPV
jgi:diphosphomevalonate decarboxylase